jgi:hypothetical protein
MPRLRTRQTNVQIKGLPLDGQPLTYQFSRV